MIDYLCIDFIIENESLKNLYKSLDKQKYVYENNLLFKNENKVYLKADRSLDKEIEKGIYQKAMYCSWFIDCEEFKYEGKKIFISYPYEAEGKIAIADMLDSEKDKEWHFELINIIESKIKQNEAGDDEEHCYYEYIYPSIVYRIWQTLSSSEQNLFKRKILNLVKKKINKNEPLEESILLHALLSVICFLNAEGISFNGYMDEYSFETIEAIFGGDSVYATAFRAIFTIIAESSSEEDQKAILVNGLNSIQTDA